MIVTPGCFSSLDSCSLRAVTTIFDKYKCAVVLTDKLGTSLSSVYHILAFALGMLKVFCLTLFFLLHELWDFVMLVYTITGCVPMVWLRISLQSHVSLIFLWHYSSWLFRAMI